MNLAENEHSGDELGNQDAGASVLLTREIV
jgi:hypothetical protein